MQWKADISGPPIWVTLTTSMLSKQSLHLAAESETSTASEAIAGSETKVLCSETRK